MRYLAAASFACVGHFAALSAISFTIGMFGIVVLPMLLNVSSVLTLGAAFLLSLVFASSNVRHFWTSRPLTAPLCLAAGLALFWIGLAMSEQPAEPETGQDPDTPPSGKPRLPYRSTSLKNAVTTRGSEPLHRATNHLTHMTKGLWGL